MLLHILHLPGDHWQGVTRLFFDCSQVGGVDLPIPSGDHLGLARASRRVSSGSDRQWGSSHTVSVHALGRLITDVMAAHDWNQAEVGRRCGVTRSRVGQLIAEPLKAVPTKKTITNLARGLEVPGWVVMDAILESMGLPTRPTHIGIEEAVAADVDLDSSGKRALLGVLNHVRLESTQGWRLAEHENANSHDTQPKRNG